MTENTGPWPGRRSEHQRANLAERLVPLAAELVCAVHDDGPDEVARVLGKIKPDYLDALAVVLAAMVDPDASVGDLLGWVDWTLRCDAAADPAPSAPTGTAKVRTSVFGAPQDVLEDHASFVYAKAHGMDPEPFRSGEREYQRLRHLHRLRRAEQAAEVGVAA